MPAGGGVQRPRAARLVPGRRGHVCVRPRPIEHALAARDVLEVRLDLGLRRVSPRPPRVGRGEPASHDRDAARAHARSLNAGA